MPCLVRAAAQDAPLTLQQLHDLTPFFHYYISQYDLRANPLPVLHKHLVRASHISVVALVGWMWVVVGGSCTLCCDAGPSCSCSYRCFLVDVVVVANHQALWDIPPPKSSGLLGMCCACVLWGLLVCVGWWWRRRWR